MQCRQRKENYLRPGVGQSRNSDTKNLRQQKVMGFMSRVV